MSERSEWLAARKAGIGASDAPPICGESPWKTALEVYLDKTGDGGNGDMTPAMRWGLRLEPALADAYLELTGAEVEKAPPIMQHPDLPWMLASLDYMRHGRIVELKTTSVGIGWGPPGTDEVPTGYILQVQHQMAVAGAPLADIAVLIGGNDFRVYTVERSQPLIDQLIEIESEFWHRVQRRDPPPPDWSHPSTPKLIKSMYGAVEGEAIQLGDDVLALVESYQALGEQEKEAAKDRERVKSQIMFAMKEAAIADLPNGTRITRKLVERKAYTVPECSYTNFTVRKGRSK